MSPISIFNDVLGPVMRGPSSSHTAGSFHIARMAADLLGGQPAVARFAFDPAGSYAQVFREQGVDRAFAMGLLGWPLTDERFDRVLELAPAEGLAISFDVRPLANAEHPNTVEIELVASTPDDVGRSVGPGAGVGRGFSPGNENMVRLLARSIGGGAVEIVGVDGWPVRLTGGTYEVLVETTPEHRDEVARVLSADGQVVGDITERATTDAGATGDTAASSPPVLSRVLLHARRLVPLSSAARSEIQQAGVGSPGFSPRTPDTRASVGQGSPALSERQRVEGHLAEIRPIAFVKRGPGLFSSAAEMIALAEARGLSLGHIALAHEAALLDLPEADVFNEMLRRLDIMRAAVAEGLSDRDHPMQLLQPTARTVFERDARGELAIGGLHTRAAARALAAMHVNSSRGVVCAAPTGGSAGVIPGVVVTLLEEGLLGRLARRGASEERNRDSRSAVGQDVPALSEQRRVEGSLAERRGEPGDGARNAAALALFAAGAIGVVVASRATFAAEVAGCQVEIGAAGAMAAAAVVEAAGGTAAQAADAAAIAFQNTMGSVCDLVQGIVEIPCHTRNAVAASNAFVCADLILGGYANPIPLDDTVDAVLAVGRMLPSELRCTARGGLAITPSALRLTKRS